LIGARQEHSILTGLLTISVIYLLECMSVATIFTQLPVGTLVDILLVFAFHLAAACAVSFGFWGPWDFRYADEKNWAVIGFVLVLAIPVWGLLGYTGAFAAVRIRNRLQLSHSDVLAQFEQYTAYEPSPPRTPVGHSSRQAERATLEQIERSGQVAPLVDILRSGDPGLTRGAIQSIGRLEKSTAVRILRQSLQDIDKQYQFYVAGQLSAIEKDYSDAIIRSRRQLQLEPDNIELKRTLAQHCAAYVFSGLLEPSVERYFVRQAMELLTEAHGLDSKRTDVLVGLARLLTHNGEYEDASKRYLDVLSVEPNHIEARLGLAEMYFRCHQWTPLRELLNELKSSPDLPDDYQAVIELWSRSASRAE
jgi:tetratricopeptide (TPR) repeat protein